MAARDALVNEKWKKQDDEARLQRELRLSQAKAFDDEDAMARMQEELQTRMTRLQMDREAKIIEIERARAVRLAKEQAEEAIEAQERASLLLRKQAVLIDTEQSSLLGMHSAQAAEAKMLHTVTLIREESSRLIDAERVHALKNSKARQDARQAQLRKEWAEKSTQQLQAVLATEGELQDHMLRLQRASIQSEADAVYASSRTVEELVGQDNGEQGSNNEFSSARRELESMGERVLSQQRERYQEMRQLQQTSGQQQASQRSDERTSRQSTSSSHSNKSHNNAHQASGPSSEFTRLQDGYYIDSHSGLRDQGNSGAWTRSLADVPAPITGAGIGYGVGVTPGSSGLTAASIAAEARGAITRTTTITTTSNSSHRNLSSSNRGGGVTVQDVNSSGDSISESGERGGERTQRAKSGSVSSHSSSTVDNQRRHKAHHSRSGAAPRPASTTSHNDGVSISSGSLDNMAAERGGFESSEDE